MRKNLEIENFTLTNNVNNLDSYITNQIFFSNSFNFLENIPNISLILYPKVGHMPPMEIPEIIAEDIKNFIVN